MPTIGVIVWHLDLYRLKETEVKNLVPIEKGQSFTEELLASTEKDLISSALFEKVEITQKKSGNTINLDIYLKEAQVIRAITVKGQLPFLEKKILRISSLQPGEPFDFSKMEESRRRIVLFYQKYGYYGTKVNITPFKREKTNVIDLKIDIKRGYTYHLGRVSVSGNTAFTENRLKNIVYGPSIFRPSLVRKQIKKIEALYLKHGYVRAKAKIERFAYNPVTKKVDVFIKINERKKLDLHFSGNRLIKNQTLKKHTSFFKEHGYDRFSIERSGKRILQFYRLNGFFFSEIETLVENDEKEIDVTFNIHEGPRTRLGHLNIEGNKKLSDKKLNAVMENKKHTLTQQGFFYLPSIADDLSKIKNYYHDEGYLDVEIEGFNSFFNTYKDTATLNIDLTEGKAYKINSILFEGNSKISTAKLLDRILIKKGKVLTKEDLERSKNRLLSFYDKNGFIYSQIETTINKDPDKPEVTLIFNISEEAPCKVGEVIIHGNYETKLKTIHDTLKIKSGDVYSNKKMLDAQLNLKRLGIFDFVNITPIGVEQEKDVIDLVVNLQERKTITLDFQVGYDSDKLGSGQILFTKRNLFGQGKQFQFRGVGGFELNRGEVTFLVPRIFGASWNLVNQYFIEYEDDENFNAMSYGGFVGTVKRFGSDWTLFLKLQISHFNIFEDTSNSSALGGNLFDNTFSEPSVAVGYDTRNNIADPTKGLYALVSTEFDTDLADPSNNFNISKFNLANYLSISKKLTLVNNFRLGKLFKIRDSEHIPANKLFFMGGNDTIRGFDEDAVKDEGGTTSLIYNGELQYQLFNSFKLAGFVDIGSLTDSFDEMDSDSFRESAGVGLRYITPIGPIRLDYGFVLDKRETENGQRFHFSFGYYF